MKAAYRGGVRASTSPAKESYAVSDANVVKLLQPGSLADPLTEVLRNGARALLAQAIEAEVAEFLAKHVELKTATGLRRVATRQRCPSAASSFMDRRTWSTCRLCLLVNS